jgi:hypothetical protein
MTGLGYDSEIYKKLGMGRKKEKPERHTGRRFIFQATA